MSCNSSKRCDERQNGPKCETCKHRSVRPVERDARTMLDSSERRSNNEQERKMSESRQVMSKSLFIQPSPDSAPARQTFHGSCRFPCTCRQATPSLELAIMRTGSLHGFMDDDGWWESQIPSSPVNTTGQVLSGLECARAFAKSHA